MKTKRTLFVVVVASLALLAAGIGSQASDGGGVSSTLEAGAAPALTIPYAGTLAADSGGPVADGAYDFTFALYEAERGGESLWSEVQGSVAVEEGTFATALGSADALPQEALQRATLWLEVGVRGPGEAGFTTLAPRQRLNTVPSTAPASPSQGMACPHDHWGGVWTGTVMGLSLTSTDSLAKATLSSNDTGVYGLGGNVGVHGEASGSSTDTYGVYGSSTNGPGVYGNSTNGNGVHGYSTYENGVYGETAGNYGWRSGVYGKATNDYANGVTGWNTGAGVGVYGYSVSGQAGYFTDTENSSDVPSVAIKKRGVDGSALSLQVWDPGGGQEPGLFIEAMDENSVYQFVVAYNGVVAATGYNTWGSDLAEMLPAVEDLEPGDLLVIGPDGKLTSSTEAYQASVAGVYSTQPGFVAGQPIEGDVPGTIPLAVVGVVPVKVSAENGPIHPGDLLVASSLLGHAMHAGPNPPQGSVIGKALEKLDDGTGVIKMLATLQ